MINTAGHNSRRSKPHEQYYVPLCVWPCIGQFDGMARLGNVVLQLHDRAALDIGSDRMRPIMFTIRNIANNRQKKRRYL